MNRIKITSEIDLKKIPRIIYFFNHPKNKLKIEFKVMIEKELNLGSLNCHYKGVRECVLENVYFLTLFWFSLTIMPETRYVKFTSKARAIRGIHKK